MWILAGRVRLLTVLARGRVLVIRILGMVDTLVHGLVPDEGKLFEIDTVVAFGDVGEGHFDVII